MTGYLGKVTNWGREIVGSQAQAEREAQWGEIPGEIVDFDAAKQTATIKPLYKPKHNGKVVDMPNLLEVPVRFPRVGGFMMTCRVKPGDKVTLRPQMRSSENYHDSGDGSASDSRSFSLADYEAFLDGGESLQSPIEDFNADEMELRSDDGKTLVQLGDDRMRCTFGKLRMVLKDNKFVQLKVKPSDDPKASEAADFHITIDVEAGQIVMSHAAVLGPDPNPDD